MRHCFSIACSIGRRFGIAALIAQALAIQVAWSDDLQFTIGAKVWANEWSSWSPTDSRNNNTTFQTIQSIASNTHVAVIPQVSARYENFLATASYFYDTTYSLGGDINSTTAELSALSASRKEFDGNIGYYILPSLAVTVGYKQIEQDFTPLLYKWAGPTVGLAGSASLRGSFGMYGTFAYGRLRLTAPVPDAAGDTHLDADYILGELGLSYGVGTPLSHLSFSVTAGYRAQIVSTRKYAVYTGFSGYAPVDVHDVTYGPAVSVLARF
jgi:hypothetical protein